MNKDFSKVGAAMLAAILNILYFLFVWPLDMWLKAVNRVAEANTKDALDLSKINSRWPILVLVKRFFYEFAIDATIVLFYPVGVLLAIIGAIKSFSYGFGDGVAVFFGTLIITYYSSVYFSILRDCMQLFIVAPVRKFVSWLDRPAQYLELDNKVQNKN